MDEIQPEKKAKTVKLMKTTTLRVLKETKKKILAELTKINRKDFGRKVKIDDYLNLALTLVYPEHIQKLQENSLSNADRFEREYKAYVSKVGPIAKDEYLGKRLSGEIASAVSHGTIPTSS